MRPYLKKPITKGGWQNGGVGPEFKPQYREKKKKKAVQLDWRCGSSGRVLTLQVQRPEFKPRSQQQQQKVVSQSRCWWLTSVILATQEAEIRRITVQSQPGQIVHKMLS
jgi:hypothetical protein